MGTNSIGHESYFVHSSVFKSSQLTNIPNGIYLLDMMNLKTFRWADTIWPQQRIGRCYLICFSFSRLSLSLSIYLPQPYLPRSSLFLSYLFSLSSGCATPSMPHGIAEEQKMIPAKLVPIFVKYGFGQCTHTHTYTKHSRLTDILYSERNPSRFVENRFQFMTFNSMSDFCCCDFAFCFDILFSVSRVLMTAIQTDNNKQRERESDPSSLSVSDC